MGCARRVVASRNRGHRRRARRVEAHRRGSGRRGGGAPTGRRGVPAVIITRTPLRISLGGGGTDLPSYYRSAEGGFLVAAAIDRHVYLPVNLNFHHTLFPPHPNTHPPS